MKVQARDPKKVYIIDNGLRTVSLASEREDWGRLAENAVYIELRRRGESVCYFKGKQETDFVTTRLGKPTAAFQVCFGDLTESTRERELTALLECLQALGLERGVVLTEAREDRERIQGKTVDFIPLHRWLLTPQAPDRL